MPKKWDKEETIEEPENFEDLDQMDDTNFSYSKEYKNEGDDDDENFDDKSIEGDEIDDSDDEGDW